VAPHPLISLAGDKEAKQSKGFRVLAARLTGDELAAGWNAEIEAAPRRGEAGKRFLGQHPRKLPDARRPGRDEEHVGQALVRLAEGGTKAMDFPDEGQLIPIDWQVPLATGRADKASGEADPNWGVGKVDLLAVGPEDRLCVVVLKVVEPEATRAGTGETPLRLLLLGLAHAAIAEANRAALTAEIEEKTGRKISDDPPALVFAATPRYWQLCRKREAQKGAAWIKELERLAGEIEESIGGSGRYLGLNLEGSPGWSYDEGGPLLGGEPELLAAWERLAGRVRPRARAKKSAVPEEVVIEADLSRPVRAYGLTESFAPGDRIQHPTLGIGVVQGEAGPGKIHVRFGEKKSLLVHERQPAVVT
jgi:hypothetical protein